MKRKYGKTTYGEDTILTDENMLPKDEDVTFWRKVGETDEELRNRMYKTMKNKKIEDLK